MALTLSSQAFAAPKFVRGHNICALNVNRYRAALGLKQTHSAAANSFLSLKRISHPVIGAVKYNSRGKGIGHVAIYVGNGMCANPSSRHQKWEVKSCNSIWPHRPFQWRF
jgi:hypothetical protein